MTDNMIITPEMLKNWEAELSHIATVLCDAMTGGWSEDEFNLLYQKLVPDLRNAAVGLANLAYQRDNPQEA